MRNRKTQLQQEGRASNWDKFVAGGVEDSHGRLLTVSAALELTKLESDKIDAAFRLGACATHEAIEIIAKAFLLDVVVDALWDEHLAGEAEFGRELSWTRTSKQL